MKSKYIIGLSAFSPNSAACLLREGEIVAAAEEERFTRIKHDSVFPSNSIKWCLEYTGLDINDIDCIAFYSSRLSDSIRVSSCLKKYGYRKKILFFSQRDSYFASAFYPSRFEEAGIMVNNAPSLGLAMGRGKGHVVEPFKIKPFVNWGNIYSSVTAFLGFKPGSDDYQVMGLSAYGEPRFKNKIIKNRFLLSQRTLFINGLLLKNLFGIPQRKNYEEIEKTHMDIASSIQEAFEEALLEAGSFFYRNFKSSYLCLSGNMALNCLANARLLEQGLFKDIWIQPAAYDAGCSLGAAFLAWHRHFGKARVLNGRYDAMKNAYLGPSFDGSYIKGFLDKQKIPHKELSQDELCSFVAGLLSQGKVIGWFQGRCEFGPRALGNRSIISDAAKSGISKRLNLEIKKREEFRPFAPAVLSEHAGDYFESLTDNPYMLFVAKAKGGARDKVPEAFHLDGSSRMQLLKKEANPLFYKLVTEYFKITGKPVIINTSFNTNNEPIVLTPEDAYKCFRGTKMDYLVLNNFILDKDSKDL
jgi:carbamoyltransferase